MFYDNKNGCFSVSKCNYKKIKANFSDLNHIQQNLWPYPNNITQGNQKFYFKFNKIDYSNSVWKDYINDINVSYNNPLDDFNKYVSQFNGSNCGMSNTLQFKQIAITTKNFYLDKLTSSTYKNYEQYTLNITSDGGVYITAETYIGVGHALSTLQQLIELDKRNNCGCCIKNLPIYIKDSPNTYYRNVMLDTGRTYFSTTSILKLLRNMGHNKMNYFDWHISDDQSFPLSVGPITEIFSSKISTDPLFKNMVGGFDINKIYTLTDITTIINTARNYGITVVPGIDTPGHCSSLMYGSIEATKTIFGNNGMQIISSYQLSKQGWLNAPEPILGYLNLADPNMSKEEHDSNIKNIVNVIQIIFDEVLSAFQLSSGKFGNRFNINADEVHTNPGWFHVIYENQTFIDYLNQLLDIFDSTKNTDIINNNNKNNKISINNKSSTWSNIKISLWIDSILSENITGTENNFIYTDNIKLKRFNNRLTIGLWNLWAEWTTTVDQNNTVINSIEGTEAVNYDANHYYMDSGYPGNMWSGIQIDYTNDKIENSLVKYWISEAPSVPSDSGYAIGFGKIYTNNFHWDYNGSTTPPLKVTGLKKLNNIIGVGLAIWTETINEGTLNSKLITNLLAASEVMWKYNNDHCPDNLYHAVYRSFHHLLKLKLYPYSINNATPVYSGENILRPFPQGNLMDEENLPDGDGNITQEYLNKNYKDWDINIRPEYVGMVNNNLMYNINPSQNGALAIAQYPLSSKFMYGYTPQVEGSKSEIYNRINPWLAEDINSIYNPNNGNQYTVKSGDYCSKIAETLCGTGSNYNTVICDANESFCKGLQPGQIINYNCKGCVSINTSKIARSNFSSKSEYYNKSTFYTDQRDAPIVLTNIEYFKE